MSNAPSTKIVTSEPSPVSGSPSTGVGVGRGTGVPADSPGPANADRERAQLMRRAQRDFFINGSPLVTIRTEIAHKLIAHSTSSVCPPSYKDEADGLTTDRALFVRLYREGSLDEAHTLCSDRAAMLSPSDREGRVVWACNFALLRRDAGDYGLALALLVMVSPFASDCHPLTRAKFHNGLGRTYELMGRLSEAVAEYETAAPLFALGGHPGEVAKPFLNIGRVKASEGSVDEARAYLERAARIAIDAGDFRLLGEIAEEGSKL